jgi:hypothetical protein
VWTCYVCSIIIGIRVLGWKYYVCGVIVIRRFGVTKLRELYNYCDTTCWGGNVTSVLQLLGYVLRWTCYVCGIKIGIRGGVDMLRVCI